MVLSSLFGKRCVRRGVTRTKEEFGGIPTYDECEAEIKAEREEKRPCPMCQEEMTKVVVLNVIIDKCPSCHSAWLDGGELDLVRKATEGGAEANLASGL